MRYFPFVGGHSVIGNIEFRRAWISALRHLKKVRAYYFANPETTTEGEKGEGDTSFLMYNVDPLA